MELTIMRWTRIARTSFLIIIISVLILACSKDSVYSTPENSTVYDITGNANGNSMLPQISDSGSATITGSYNAFNGVLTYNIMWKALTGIPAFGGFYIGSIGTNGAAFGKTLNFDSTANANSAVSGQIILSSAQAQQLTAGNWYYVIGTATHPQGEIRGQITTVLREQ
jgi:hypothetical protein